MKVLLIAVVASAVIAATNYKSPAELSNLKPQFLNSERAN